MALGSSLQAGSAGGAGGRSVGLKKRIHCIDIGSYFGSVKVIFYKVFSLFCIGN